MMMVNLELERRLQWSRREGGESGHRVNAVRRERCPWEKKKEEGKIRSKRFVLTPRCSTIYSFTTSLNLRKNFSFFRRFHMGRIRYK